MATLTGVRSLIEDFQIQELSAKNRKTFSNSSGPLIPVVRERFLEKYEKEPDFYYIEDVEKIRNDDWFVKRFILARHRDVDQAVTMMVEAMKWRRSEGIRDLTGSYFPDDLWKLSSMFVYAPDKLGNITIHFRVRYVIKAAEMVSTLKKFGNYILSITDEETNGSGISVVADFQGTGIQNAEIDLLFDAISIMKNYFPVGINHIIIVDLPWILRACWGMAKSWVPENRRKLVEFITRKELVDFVAIENLPDYLGGTCNVPYAGNKMVPKGCPTTYRFATDTLGLSEKAADKMTAMYKPIAENVNTEQTDKEWYQKAKRYS